MLRRKFLSFEGTPTWVDPADVLHGVEHDIGNGLWDFYTGVPSEPIPIQRIPISNGAVPAPAVVGGAMATFDESKRQSMMTSVCPPLKKAEWRPGKVSERLW